MLTKAGKLWPMAPILLFALTLRILFAPGVGFEGSFEVMHSASLVASALKPLSPGYLLSALPDLQAQLGLRGIVANSPLGVIYAVFGESDLVTRSFGLLCSLAVLVMVYLVARHLAGERTAALAALVYALIPQDIFYSGTLTHFTFWLPIALFAAYLGLGFSQLRIGRVVPLVLISAILLLVVEIWLAIFLILFCICVFTKNTRPRVSFLLAGLATLFGFLAYVFVYWQDLESWRETLLDPGLYLLIPLFGVSLVAAFKSPDRDTNTSFLWLLSGAAAFLAGLAAGSPAADLAAVVLVLTAGFCFLSGRYLARLLPQNFPFVAIAIVMGVTLVLAFFGIRAQQEFIPSFSGLNWLGIHSLFLFTNIAGGFFVFLMVLSAIAYPAGKRKAGTGIGLLLLALLPFAMLSPIWGKVFPYRMLTETIRSSAQALARLEYLLPVHGPNPQDRDLLTYYLAQMESKLQIVKGWDSPAAVGDGYVLSREGYLRDVPENWLNVDTFGWNRAPTRLVLHRSLTTQSAAVELQTVNRLLEDTPSSQNYDRLYEALINSGEYCQAYAAWMNAKQLGGGPADSIPILADQECFENLAGEAINLDVERLPVFEGSIEASRSGSDKNGASIWQVRRRYDFYYDPRIFDLSESLFPDAFYLYSVNVKGRDFEPFYTLYWRTGITEGYLDKKPYPVWERVSLLIYSGQTPAGEVDFHYSPILIDNFGIVFVSWLELFQVSPP